MRKRGCANAKNFNPLPPCGGRRRSSPPWCGPHRFQSTPSVWRETPYANRHWIDSRTISIHSLRVEGDASGLFHRSSTAIFQSTPSVWRETSPSRLMRDSIGISIHSLRVEGDVESGLTSCSGRTISIHSLRVEGDIRYRLRSRYNGAFQSTPSVWRETPWAESPDLMCIFQSTPSVWRETVVYPTGHKDRIISIHSLRVEGDDFGCVYLDLSFHFNPLPPCGGRRVSKGVLPTVVQISIHSLRVEGDRFASCKLDFNSISIHSLRVEGDPISQIMRL